MTKKRTRKLTPIPELELRIKVAHFGGYDIVLFGVLKHPLNADLHANACTADLEWCCIVGDVRWEELCAAVRSEDVRVFAVKLWYRDWHTVPLMRQVRLPSDLSSTRWMHSPPAHAPKKVRR